MSTNNALFFLTVGLLMYGLPSLTPESFPPHLVYGTNTSALWLAFMGVVVGFMGASFLAANEVWPLVRSNLEWPPQPVESTAPVALVVRPDILLSPERRRRATNQAAA
ncbi:MAG TPA: hypothetical protein VFJ90_01270 [Candidatus Didemnitutus sp.]|nr:hypothetical protein [Candidatus Didemnitutus sp.]